jgi:CBS domain containing-hemolysin-like protein
VLIFGNALFVAAEFSLTALDRSTVEANARSGRRRDRLIQRAQHRLSFQLSGAQLGISITTLATGYLTEPMVADLPHPWFDAIGIPDPVADAFMAFLALVIVTSVSMVFGELVPKYLAVARPLRTARAVVGPQFLFSLLLTPRSCGRPARRRSCCRWCGPRPAAAPWTWAPHRWCGDRCSSAP